LSDAKISLNVLLHRVGVNMGDHAETVVDAHDVDESETVGDLARRLLMRNTSPWLDSVGGLVPEGGWRIEIRVATPAPEHPATPESEQPR